MKVMLAGIVILGIVLMVPVTLFVFMLGARAVVHVNLPTPEPVMVAAMEDPVDSKLAALEAKLDEPEIKPEAPVITPAAPEPKSEVPKSESEAPKADKKISKAKPKASSPEPAPQPVDPSRPSWVGKPAKLEKGVYRMSVPSGLYVTRLECERALDLAMHSAVEEYIENYLGIEEAKLVSLDDRYIKNNIQKDEYEETVVRSVGPMQQVVALLEFNDKVRSDIMDRYRAAIVHMRLWKFGSGALAVLALLGTLFSYLKLDHLTSGTHRRRLQWAAAATILGVVAGAALIQTQAFSARL